MSDMMGAVEMKTTASPLNEVNAVLAHEFDKLEASLGSLLGRLAPVLRGTPDADGGPAAKVAEIDTRSEHVRFLAYRADEIARLERLVGDALSRLEV